VAEPSGERTPWSPRIAAFLGAEALSAIGSFATVIAIWGYAAYEYDASAGEVSLFGMAFVLPGVLFGPVAGAAVDRFGAKPTLAAAKVLGIAGALALLTADSFLALAGLSLAHGVAFTFSMPALQSLPPRLVDDQHLARTNALVSLTDELAIVLGPVVGGLAIAAFGFRGAFVVDAATYALGLVVLPLVQPREPVHADGTDGEDDPGPVRLRDTLEGWRLVARTPVLRRVVATTATVHLLYGAALLAEPLYVRDVLEQSEEVFAALQTAFGIFLVGGGLLSTRLGERLATFGWITVGVGGSGLFAIVYLGTPWIAVAFLGVALWGVATALISGPSRTVLQRSTPPRAHGRVLAADLVAGSAAELVGIGLAGVLIGAIEVPATLAVLGGGAVVAAALLAVADRRDRTPAPAEVGDRELALADVGT
jgi:DHA3 family macrolide efflux protein-like MFS transporter